MVAAATVVVVVAAATVVVVAAAMVVVGPPPPPPGEVTVNETAVAEAATWGLDAAILASMVHVPVSLNVTTPVELLMSQTSDVVLRYVIAPVPADGVASMVGGVALLA